MHGTSLGPDDASRQPTVACGGSHLVRQLDSRDPALPRRGRRRPAGRLLQRGVLVPGGARTAPDPRCRRPITTYLGVAPEFREPLAARFAPDRLKPRPPGRNVARAAVAWRASGQYDSASSGDRAFDGSADTKWCDGQATAPHYLALDLGATRSLTGFVLKNASFAGEQEGFDTLEYRVETGPSLDGPWAVVSAVDNATTPTDAGFGSAINTVAFPNPVPARFVRFHVIRPCALDSVVRIPELEVYAVGAP